MQLKLPNNSMRNEKIQEIQLLLWSMQVGKSDTQWKKNYMEAKLYSLSFLYFWVSDIKQAQ